MDVPGPRFCLRCKTVPLRELDRLDPQVTFFECPGCRRQYTLIPGGELTFRWLHPISLPLYGVIFDSSPVQRAAEIAGMIARERTAGELEEMVREITLELGDPTQQVRDIVRCRAPEEELREYLRLFCEHVRQGLQARRD